MGLFFNVLFFSVSTETKKLSRSKCAIALSFNFDNNFVKNYKKKRRKPIYFDSFFVKNNIIKAIKIRMKSDTLLKEDKIIGS